MSNKLRSVLIVLFQGGIVTHEYNLFKGFAAKAPEKIMETVQALGASHNVMIEKDQEVSINSS